MHKNIIASKTQSTRNLKQEKGQLQSYGSKFKNNRVEKRGYELVEEGDDAQHHLTQSKKPKLPGLARYFFNTIIKYSFSDHDQFFFFFFNLVILLRSYCGVQVLYACQTVLCVCMIMMFVKALLLFWIDFQLWVLLLTLFLHDIPGIQDFW